MKPASFAYLAAAFMVLIGQGQAQAANRLELSPLATYETGIFNKSAAEIVVYNKSSKLFYVVNGATPSIDVFRLKGTTTESLPALSLAPTEVAVHNPAQDGRPGKVILFSTHHKRIADFPAGALPDMVAFSPDGKYLLVANEGEADKNSDPEGSLTLIIINAEKPNMSLIRQISFKAFRATDLRKTGIRIAPGKNFAQDVEPEYIAFSADSRRAWVSLQENNALAEVSLKDATITRIIPLGLKDHSLPGQGIDPNDKGGINIISVPVMGMYMPDAIAVMNSKGKSYILTANEGDARDEEVKAKKAKFDAQALTKAQIKSLGKLRISATDGDTDNDGDIDIPHSYGARSFSIFSDKGKLLYDSGDDFEQITAKRLGDFFNSDNKKANSADKRSDNKGPEPEGITVGTVAFAFITLERVGGIMVYDVTDPYAPVFQSYYVSRTFGTDMDFDVIEDRKKPGSLALKEYILSPHRTARRQNHYYWLPMKSAAMSKYWKLTVCKELRPNLGNVKHFPPQTWAVSSFEPPILLFLKIFFMRYGCPNNDKGSL